MRNEILEKAKELFEMIEEEQKKGMVQLSDIPVGGKFSTGLGNFIVLEQKEEGTAVVTENLYKEDVKFDNESNKYPDSELYKLFVEEICPDFEKEFGENNLLDAPVSLITVDGQNESEFMTPKVRPLSFDEARKYNPMLVNEELPDWYWTLTAWSTEERGWGRSVAVGSPAGRIGGGSCRGGGGVRPFCILKSNIFVSKVEE